MPRSLSVAMAAAFLLLATTARAQKPADYLVRYDAGLGVETLTLRGSVLDVPFYYLGVTAGYNFPLYPIDKNLSFGLSPNVTMLIDLFMNDDGKLGVRGVTLPLFATFKAGGDATLKCEIPIGATLGIGALPGWYIGSEETDFYGGVAFMAEVSLKLGALVKLRYISNIGRYSLDNGNSFDQHGVYLVVTNTGKR